MRSRCLVAGRYSARACFGVVVPLVRCAYHSRTLDAALRFRERQTAIQEFCRGDALECPKIFYQELYS